MTGSIPAPQSAAAPWGADEDNRVQINIPPKSEAEFAQDRAVYKAALQADAAALRALADRPQAARPQAAPPATPDAKPAAGLQDKLRQALLQLRRPVLRVMTPACPAQPSLALDHAKMLAFSAMKPAPSFDKLTDAASQPGQP